MQGEALPPQEIESALAVIRQALHNEIAGQRFYSDAAFYCIDLWAKEIFADLAQEEQVHTQVLLQEYESLKTEGRWLDLAAAQANGTGVEITQIDFADDMPALELFPPQMPVERAVDRQADDLIALAFGIKMEQETIALYAQAAQDAVNSVARTIFNHLVEEETRHYYQLKTRWEGLAGMAYPES